LSGLGGACFRHGTQENDAVLTEPGAENHDTDPDSHLHHDVDISERDDHDEDGYRHEKGDHDPETSEGSVVIKPLAKPAKAREHTLHRCPPKDQKGRRIAGFP